MLLYQYYHLDARVQNYVYTLLKNDMEVDVICLEHELTSSIHEDGLRLIELPLQRKSKDRNYFWEYFVCLLFFTGYTIWNYIRRGYHIIHIHNMPDFLIFAAILPKILGCKIILDIHDPMPEFFLSKFQKRTDSLLGKLLVIEERVSALFADEIITANENFRQVLQNRGIPENKITVVINVANPKIFYQRNKIRTNKDKYILVFPGTLAARYGLDIPIIALPELLKTIPNIMFRLIGDKNDYTDTLSVIAVTLGMQDHFEILASVPLEQIPALLSDCDIGIYPAIPDPHMSIATPGKILEYAAMDLPIVSSKLQAVSIYFPESCVSYFEPGSINGFTSCILNLYNNPARVQSLLENMQKMYIQVYTYEKEQAKYLNLIKTKLI